MHRLLVADDHPLFREAISGVIAAGLEASEVLEAASLAEALRLATTHETLDLVLLDLGLPDADGLSGLTRLREAAPELAVVIVSAEQQRATVLEALELGAVGYIPKSTPRETLLDALRQVLEGQVYLPPTIMRTPPAPAASPAPLAENPLT
ncbi:response regulator, partial [Halomonas sp. NCCP-2165]